MYVCMYVCMLPFMELPMGSGVQLGLGEGPIGIMGPISHPRGTIDNMSRKLTSTNA